MKWCLCLVQCPQPEQKQQWLVQLDEQRQQQQNLLFEDNIIQVIENIKTHAERKPELQKVVTYFENNQQRMLYGTYKTQGLLIASGAIESAGKRMSP